MIHLFPFPTPLILCLVMITLELLYLKVRMIKILNNHREKDSVINRLKCEISILSNLHFFIFS